MDDRSQFESKLARLGRRHEYMGIPKQYLEVMGPIFCQTIRPVLMAAAAMPAAAIDATITSSTTPESGASSATAPPAGTTPATLWGRDSKSAWLRFFRIIAFQMKRGYTGTTQHTDSDNDEVGALGVDTSTSNLERCPSSGGVHTQGGKLQKRCSTDNSQYLLLHHPSTGTEGSHIAKKRMARHKMLALSGFAKSFDVGPSCPMGGQNISSVTGTSTNPYVISDSHAQRKAMFQKQCNQHNNRRVSIDESCDYVR